MQDRANGLLRIPLPRTPVNKDEKRKGRGCFEPLPAKEISVGAPS
jgi:hypothetical protein